MSNHITRYANNRERAAKLEQQLRRMMADPDADDDALRDTAEALREAWVRALRGPCAALPPKAEHEGELAEERARLAEWEARSVDDVLARCGHG